jgi:diguanylate cyclase (GGDEF)-like protein/PAS domain S-box-containing protein
MRNFLNRFFYTLRNRISLLVVTLTLTLALIVSMGAGEISRAQITQRRGARLLQFTQQFAQQLDIELFEYWREVQFIATLDAVRAPNADPAEARELLAQLVETHPFYSWVGLTDTEGTVLVSTGGMLEGQSVAARPWFIEASKAPFVGDVHEAVLLASLLPAPVNNEPLRFLDIAAPFYDDAGEFAGVLGVHMNWEWARRVMSNTLQHADGDIVLTILNRDGNLLLSSSEEASASASIMNSRLQSGGTGNVVEVWADGNTYLTGFTYDTGYETYPGLGWIIRASQPLSSALAPAYTLRQQILLVGLLVGVVFAVVGWAVARYLTAPLHKLAVVSGEIQEGQTPAVPVGLTGHDEVSQLSRTISTLLTTLNLRNLDLQTLNASLEMQVRERTQAAEQRAQALSDEISIRQQVEGALRESQETFRRVTESILHGIAITVDGEIMYANQTLLNMFGYSSQEMIGLADELLIAPDARSYYATRVDSVFFETEGVYVDGGTFPVEVFKRPLTYYGRQGRVLFIRDITQRRQEQEEMHRLHQVTSEQLVELQQVYSQLSYQAAHDYLTGLVNRKQFEKELIGAVEAAGDDSVAVFYIDLDRFKLVNDTLGHAAGDDLLRQVAQRLRECIAGNAILARLGGDEFALLLPDVTTPDEATTIARKMLDVLQAAFVIEDTAVNVTSSIGISFYPADAQTTVQLVQKADTALYEAKKLGRNQYYLASDLTDEDVALRVRLEHDMHEALERGDFVLEYQPQYSLRTEQIAGFEALIRWQHPELGIISPGDFIPIAEETGLILPMSQWVLEEACRAVAGWQASHAGVKVSVNISTLQAGQAEFAGLVMQTLKKQGVPPALVTLEITESILMGEKDLDALETLHAAGIEFAIDDFGTGYSSLSYLQRFPVSSLKIDRSFVRNIDSEKSRALVKAMITMAHSLEMQVVAEGVEEREQLEMLRSLDCDLIQGFLISQSLPQADVVLFLDAFSQTPAP